MATLRALDNDRQAPAERAWLRTTWFPASLMVGVAVIVLIVLRETPWPFDPMFYMDNAGYFSASRGSLSLEHRSLRWGLVLPLSVLQTMFGYSEASYYGLPILATALLALGVFFLARRLMGAWWAAGAGLLTVANPLLLARSSHPFPDVLGTALLVLGIASLVWMGGGTRVPNVVLAGLAGLSFGFAYAAREAVVLLAPVVVVALIILRTSWKNLLVIAAGALAVLGIETILMSQWFDDPLARINVLLDRNTRPGQVPNPTKAEGVAAFQGTVGLSLTAMFRKWGQFGLSLVPFLGMAGLVAAWTRSSDGQRRRTWLVLGSWLVLGWLTFVLVGPWQNGRGGFVFNLTQVRYWYVLVPPVAIGITALFEAFSRARPLESVGLRRLSVLMTIGFSLVLAWAVLASSNHPRQIATGTDHMLELREWIIDDSAGTSSITAAHRAIRVANLFDNGTFGQSLWSGQTSRLASAVSPTVVMIADEDLRVFPVTVDGARHELAALPESWDLLLVADDGLLALVAGGDWDGQPNSIVPLVGPETPLSLADDRVARWSNPEDHEGPSRYRVEYVGETPRGRCVTIDASGGFSGQNALYTIEGVESGTGYVIDMFCPDTTTYLSLRSPDGEMVQVLGVSLIASGSSG